MPVSSEKDLTHSIDLHEYQFHQSEMSGAGTIGLYMNTSSSEIEDILHILQDGDTELSISELSRKTGVNRNKVSLIAETLFKKGIVHCNQSSNAKKYSYLPCTTALTLIESIPDPALILDSTLHIVRINQAFLDQTREGELAFIGERLSAINHLYHGINEEAISSVLTDRYEGYRTSIHPDQSQIRYICIRVTLPDNQPGVLLYMHPDADAYNPGTLFRKFVEKLFSKIPGMVEEQQAEKIYDTITRILRDIFADDIIVSFLIDEKSRISHLNTISVPESIRKPTRSEIDLALSQKTPVSFEGPEILPYKLYDTVRIKGISPLMLRSPDDIARVFNPLQGYEFIYTGIAINDTLTGIIGIGKMNVGIPPDVYEKILLALSRFFYLYESNRTKSVIHEEVIAKYKEEYRNMYHLLTEKTEQDENRRAESEALLALIGIMSDQMSIACCTLTPERTISSANTSMLDLCSAEETDVLKKPRFEDVVPSPVREVIADLINSSEHQTEIGSYQVAVKTSDQTQSSWCLIRSQKEGGLPCICIGEKAPSPLIQFILMYEYRNCQNASSRRAKG